MSKSIIYCTFEHIIGILHNMDLLADILKLSGVQKRMLNQRELDANSVLKFPCNKSIGFHVVTHGEVTIEYANKKRLSLKRGDLALMARGIDHQLKAAGTGQTTLVSGAYQFWNEPLHPFFKELTEWHILKAEEIESFDSIHQVLQLLSKEAAQSDLGSEGVVQSLLDILFNLILRKIVKRNSVAESTWSFASQNQQISQALQLLHQDFKKEWTLEDLAQEVGLSRAGFAQKFKKSLGDTPLHYLTTLRLQKAMDLLSQTEDKIELVAEQVGYKDAFGFSKVFKKHIGKSPKDFRKQAILDNQTGWKY